MEDLLSFLKCIADENRLKILKLLLDSQHCVCQLQELLDKSQSSISQHLSYFKDLDLLNEKHQAKWTYYSIDRNVYDSYLADLVALKSNSLSELNLPELAVKVENLDAAREINPETKEGRGC